MTDTQLKFNQKRIYWLTKLVSPGWPWLHAQLSLKSCYSHFLSFFSSPSSASLWMCSVTSVMSDCHAMDCSLPGYSVHGVLQAVILEWVAMPSSRGSSQPRNQTQVSCIAGGFFTAEPLTSLCSMVNEHSTELGKRQLSADLSQCLYNSLEDSDWPYLCLLSGSALIIGPDKWAVLGAITCIRWFQ